MNNADCTHTDQIEVTSTDANACPDCVKLGDSWVHLRMCLVCGNVGCCDSSKNTHATKHYQATDHPVMRSVQPGEAWVWCYVDEVMVGEIEA